MSNLFKKAVASLKASKNLDTVLSGSGYLDEGTYGFTVQAVDNADISDNKVNITYLTDDGKTFTDRAFAATKAGDGLSKSVRLLVTGCIPDKDALGKLIAALDDDDHALEMLTGMKFQGTLKRGPGFQVRAVGTGGYAAFESGAADAAQIGDSYENVKDAREAAKAAGHTQGYVRLESVVATHAKENLAAFEKALAGRGKAKPAAIGKAI